MIELIVGFFVLILATGIFLWVMYTIIGDLMGAPFVPVSTLVMDDILNDLKMKKGANFWDLGSGNGKVVFAAVSKYGVCGNGVEINPFLIFFCRLKAKLKHLNNAIFFQNNFYKTDLSKADYIYFYLFNTTVEKVARKLEKECKKGTVVISRAFEIKSWKNRQIKKLDTKGWITYFYKV